MNPPSSVILPYPVLLTPREKQNYFIPPDSFNLGAMLSNPMMLLMVGGAGMMLAMPYLMVSPLFSVNFFLSLIDFLIRKIWTQKRSRTSRSNKINWEGYKVPFKVGISNLGK